MKNTLKILFLFLCFAHLLFAANPLTMKIMTGADFDELDDGEKKSSWGEYRYFTNNLERDDGHYVYIVFFDKQGNLYGEKSDYTDECDGIFGFVWKDGLDEYVLGPNTLTVSISKGTDIAYIDYSDMMQNDIDGEYVKKSGNNYYFAYAEIPISTYNVTSPSSFTVKVEAKLNGYTYSGTYTDTVYPEKTFEDSMTKLWYIETSKGIVVTGWANKKVYDDELQSYYVNFPSKINGKYVVEIDPSFGVSSYVDYIFKVEDDNKLFCNVEGSLYSKDKKILYQAFLQSDHGDEYYVQPGTTAIAHYAFSLDSFNDRVDTIYLPDSIKEIWRYGLNSFGGYNNQKRIFFDGPPPTYYSYYSIDVTYSSYQDIYVYKSQGWEDYENSTFLGRDVHFRDESERVVGVNFYAYDENWDETDTLLGGNTYYLEPYFIHGDGEEEEGENASDWSWTISSGSSYASIAMDEDWGSEGILTTSSTDTTRSITVTLKSLRYPDFSKSMTFSVVPDSIDAIGIRGNDAIGAGYAASYTAYGTLLSGKEEKLDNVTWSIVDGSANATVSDTGVVTAKNVNATVYITLQAEYVSGKTRLVGQKRISIEPSVKELTVNVGGTVVHAGYTSQLSATALYGDGSTSVVTTNAKWSLAKEYPGVTLTESGEIKVADSIEAGSDILLICEYSDRGVPRTTTATIAVSPSIPMGDELFVYTYALRKGWNLISIVLDLTPLSKQTLLAHTLYEYDSPYGNEGCFRQVTDIVPGRAYWLQWEDPSESLVLTGYPFGNIAKQAEGMSRISVNGVEDYGVVGETITVTAPEKDGYSFKNWTVDGVAVSDTTSETISFTMPDNEVTVTPNYTRDCYYQLTVDGNASLKKCGEAISVTAATKTGYTFSSWTVEGVSVSKTTANPISFIMPANDVTLTANYRKSGGGTGGTYLVVNLSNGSYSYTETAPDLSSDTCRTTELWLRRIPAGTFTMGSPTDEVGRWSNETQHQVTLSEDFYIGVFEMTQKQYELIYGSNPSGYTGDTRPVEQVSYNTIRGSSTGAGWPSSRDVDSTSFLGKLRTKTGLSFDLPTEAQWEYACRAGSTTALNTGKNLTSTGQDSAMDEAGRYWYNGGSSSKHTKVGSYLPNNWGLYDMHGNVWEWCLDWYQSDLGSAAVTDPVGGTSGSSRVARGGCWSYNALYCRSAYRDNDDPSSSGIDYGFRVVLLP